jgi:hypothetical protein
VRGAYICPIPRGGAQPYPRAMVRHARMARGARKTQGSSEEVTRRAREESAESGGNGAENNDDARTGTRAFVAGERGASERGANADQRDANECHADEQETEALPEAIVQRR